MKNYNVVMGVVVGQRWEGNTKANAGRSVEVVEWDIKTASGTIFEKGVRNERRHTSEISLRMNWRPLVEAPKPADKPAPIVEPAPLLVDQGREEELALLRRIADSLDKLHAVWVK
jgi:hypothetical protein